MEEPIIANMKIFVKESIENVAEEHEKMISGWKSVKLTDENTRHLYNLFTKCNRDEVRLFEKINFLNVEENESCQLCTTRLTQVREAKETDELIIPTIRVTQDTEEPILEDISSDESVEDVPVVEPEVLTPEITETTEETRQEEDEVPDVKGAIEEPNTLNCKPEHSEQENNNVPLAENVVITSKQKRKMKRKEMKKDKKENMKKEKPIKIEAEQELEQKEEEVGEEGEESSDSDKFKRPMDRPEKRVNPFDNEKCMVEPLITTKPFLKAMDDIEENLNSLDNIAGKYINPESKTLKSNLQRLATDISEEEKNIRARIESGEPASTDNGVLADFISRANTVLKQTEAVTVRKIAEAETRKFLTSVNVNSEPCFESISNELMQDIWPKTNRWRSIARVRCGAQEPEESIPQGSKKKMEEQLDRAIQAAIKSAGEPLNKRQIGKIRNAAIVYRDFDAKEERELNFRSDHALKLVKYVSAYEATNQMDELTRLRLAIAFCTKRRDYFLKFRPQNFMQFSYMYIFLLEKINTKTASICACLNYHSTLKTNFDELEELLLNLFHEDYFLNDSGT